MSNRHTLRFSLGGNAKLPKSTASFSIPSGHTCPGAKKCLAKANRETGKITDGPDAEFRCYQASQEAAFRHLRERNWHNLELLRVAHTRRNIRNLILDSLPAREQWSEMRIHVGGDFFKYDYFMAWLDVAERCEDQLHLFYVYTTSGHLFPRFVKEQNSLPGNFRLIGSAGGKFDEHYPLVAHATAHVIMHPDDTTLQIDRDEQLARNADHDFALLIHGTQPAGSSAAQATQRLRHEGVKFAYTSK